MKLNRNPKDFEYMPDWIEKGKRVKVFFEDEWRGGTITSTPKENDRGVEITTDKPHPKGNLISLPVYMCYRSPLHWKAILEELKTNKKQNEMKCCICESDKLQGVIFNGIKICKECLSLGYDFNDQGDITQKKAGEERSQ